MENKKKPNKVNMPRFNMSWMYMIIALMLLGLYFTNESGSVNKETSYDQFQQYVKSGYVSKVIGYDDNSVEAYIKPYFVKDVFKQDSNRVGKNPMITTEAPSRESLGEFLQKERDEAHFDGAVSYEKKKGLLQCYSLERTPYRIPDRFVDVLYEKNEWWRRICR